MVPDLPVIRTVIAAINFVLKGFREPRSKVKIEQTTADRGAINESGDWVTFRWELTAFNEGQLPARVTDPVFETATCFINGQRETITPDDVGKGSVEIGFVEKDEQVVESNAKIELSHRLSKKEGIHDYVTESDSMTFRYSAFVEDGSTPYKIEIEGAVGVSGLTIRWNR